MSEPRSAAISDFLPTVASLAMASLDHLPYCCRECSSPITVGQMITDAGAYSFIHAACEGERP